MKLPISVGNKLFYRVIFPGAVLAVSCARATQTFLHDFGIKIPIEYTLPVEIFIFGWIFVVLDMPIYMAFEGRRFWPARLWLFAFQCEHRRLLKQQKEERRN